MNENLKKEQEYAKSNYNGLVEKIPAGLIDKEDRIYEKTINSKLNPSKKTY